MAKAAPWDHIDAHARKRGERTGLDTLVVHALNDANWTCDLKIARLRETIKLATWGVRSQE